MPESSPSSSSSSIATLRTPGYDIARAIALLGMVLVNFRGKLHSYDHGLVALQWLGDRIEGKAGALFVLLAGVGISLRTHRASGTVDMRAERRVLFERASILLLMGLLLMHLWVWDILHFYGVYMLMAIPLLRVQSRTLWLLAAVILGMSVALMQQLPWDERPSLLTVHGAALHLLFNGLYPVFPWWAILLVGMAVGRLDLQDRVVRRRVLGIALVVVGLTETCDIVARYEQQTGVFGLGEGAAWLRTWPRAPRPLFVISGCAIGVAVICACIEVTRTRTDRRWVMALVATGQLAFTLYVAHVIAILVPIDHGLLRGMPLQVAFLYGLAFYVVAIAFAVWWRRRWEYGPFEQIIRQVTGRERPGPWGGTRLRGR
jgi:uncharacterized membrane protein YeiB